MKFSTALKTILTALFFTLISWVSTAAPLNTSNVEEIKKQWNYLDQIKASNDKGMQKKSRRLLRAIENHFYANSVYFEVDPQNSSSLLLKILSKPELLHAHPLNRFAASLFQKYAGLRIEINPLKLKLDQAGALYDEESNRLTLAYDNIIELKADSFVGHELIHARFEQYERKGLDHVFMGWLKRKPSTPALQETYPDAFSLDEIVAYDYQALTLLHEELLDSKTKKTPADFSTARDFLQIGLQLVNYLTSDEISQFAETYLQDAQSKQVTSDQDEMHDIIRIETQRYILELNFAKNENRSTTDLRRLALDRLSRLRERAQLISQTFRSALQALNQNDGAKALDILSASRDQVIRK